MDVAVAAEERFLDGVRGRVAVVDDAHDEREQVVLVERDELVERIEVAVHCALDQGAVHAALATSSTGRRDGLAAPRSPRADDLVHELRAPQSAA